MRILSYASALVRRAVRASTLGVLVIPILFVAAVIVERRGRSLADAGALYAAASSPDPRVMREAVAGLAELDARDHCGYTPLGLMAAYGRRDAIEMLLHRGAAVDAPHPLLGTPLMLALRNGNVEIARALLARGADANVCCDGFDPLGSAVASNDLECVKTVLAAGADPHATGRRFSLLTLAVQSADVSVMRALLTEGVDPNVCDADGTTPLINAVESDATECARLLIAAGADISRAGPGGHTPRGVAQRRGCGAMLELMESVGK